MTTLIGTKSQKLYVGYCVFVAVPEMQVLSAGLHVISAIRLFHGLDPAVAKALSSILTRRVVILARSALLVYVLLPPHRNDAAHRTYATPRERLSSVYMLSV
jgi:hypothetical protein